MNTLFGLPRTVVALAAIVVAIILVVLVGMIIIGSAAIRALMAPGVKVEGVSLLALLVTIIVLLSAIFVLLLVLLWCCCRHARGGKDGQLPPNVVTALLPLLPVLPDIRDVLSETGKALYASGKAIEWMQDKMSTAAGFIHSVANDADTATDIRVRVPVIPFVSYTTREFNPLDVVVGNLRSVANNLSPDISFPLGNTTVHVADVKTALEKAGKSLGKMSKALGGNPPNELLLP